MIVDLDLPGRKWKLNSICKHVLMITYPSFTATTCVEQIYIDVRYERGSSHGSVLKASLNGNFSRALHRY